jgi:hypothetical protein
MSRRQRQRCPWSEALILAQSDVPTTGALNLMMKWEKVVAEGKSDAIAVCCTCIAELCGFYCCYSCLIRFDSSLLFVVVAFSTGLVFCLLTVSRNEINMY